MKKPGDTVTVSLRDITRPLIGTLVFITPFEEETYQARIMSMDETGAVVKVVPESVKE